MIVSTTFDFHRMLSNAREAYGEELMKMADEGIDFSFTYSDNVAPTSSMGKFIQKYPERCFNFGIAEANQVGASAGLALSGELVFAQVFGPFLPLRAADQIHTDIAYNNTRVRLIGTHAGVTSGGGPTHNVIADLAFYRAVPNLAICVPADADQCMKIVRASVDFPGPMVIRIARGAEPTVYTDTNYEYKIGSSITTKPGNDLVIISNGSSVYWSLMAAKLLEEQHQLSVCVIDMHTLRPFDAATVEECRKKYKCIITVEEHGINGGLGGAVAEYLAEHGFTGKFKRIGLPDEFSVLGDPMEIYKYYHMDPEGIAATVWALLNK